MIIENTEPYTAETIRLAPVVLQLRSAALGLGLMLVGAALGAAMFGRSMFLAGYAASTLYRTVQSYIDARGTYAILALCVAIPVVLVWRGNHIIAGTYPADWI